MIDPQSCLIITLVVCFGIALAINIRFSENKWDKLPYYIFGVPVVTTALVIIPFLIITILSKEVSTYEVIEQVGGCDRSGTCGIITKSGVYQSRYPVVGASTEVHRERIWKYEF